MNDYLEGENLIWRGRPSWRSMLAFYIKWLLLAIIPMVVVLVVIGVTDADWPWWVGVLITAIGAAIVVLIGWLMRIGTVYTVTDQRILIRRGILARRESSAHIDRVQNVNYTQSPVQRLLKVGTVDFDTAGTDDYEFKFIGVNDPRALRETIANTYGQRIRDQQRVSVADPEPR